MLTSFSEFKYYQSFRVPVESRDDVMFLVEHESDSGKFEFIDVLHLSIYLLKWPYLCQYSTKSTNY
jgi:hypothetical protein